MAAAKKKTLPPWLMKGKDADDKGKKGKDADDKGKKPMAKKPAPKKK